LLHLFIGNEADGGISERIAEWFIRDWICTSTKNTGCPNQDKDRQRVSFLSTLLKNCCVVKAQKIQGKTSNKRINWTLSLTRPPLQTKNNRQPYLRKMTKEEGNSLTHPM
jgi:hypothetical protein